MHFIRHVAVIFLFALSSCLAWSQEQFEVSDCTLGAFIVENVGYMHTINATSHLELNQKAENRFSITKHLSSDYKTQIAVTTENQTLNVSLLIYKNNQLYRRKNAAANLENQDANTYYTSEHQFLNIYDANPALNDSDLLSIKIRCLVGRKSNWLW